MLSGTVAVTGGTGFIGGRIVERFALETPVDLRVLVRSYSSVSRVARFPLDIRRVDLADAAAVERAVAGVDVVIHAALDAADLRWNLEAAENLARSCLAAGVRRLVHLSTFSVYEPFPVGDLDENSPRPGCGSPYAEVKLAIENLLARYHRDHGLPVAILQPTIVYGPFGGSWTIDPVFQLRRGRVVLPDDGEGLCNAVYVDDVASAVFKAASVDSAVGERLLVSWNDPVTWRSFFESYEKILGVRSLDFMQSADIERAVESTGPLATARRLVRDPHRVLDYGWARSLYRLVRSTVGERRWSRVRRKIPPHVAVPDAGRLSLYRSRARVRIDRARRVLGWEPRYDLESGMRLTGEFIRWARL